jgi:signal-transduction protein with cAMP-binding, CBS, and nucleotidyltransferase domain
MCRLDDTIHSCAREMANRNLGFLPVVNDKGVLIGTITDRDLTIRALAEGKSADTNISEFYSDNPVHLNQHDALAQAESIMMDAHIRRVVVVDEQKKPIGVVLACDVAEHEEDAERIGKLFKAVLQRSAEPRTVEAFKGSSCCG